MRRGAKPQAVQKRYDKATPVPLQASLYRQIGDGIATGGRSGGWRDLDSVTQACRNRSVNMASAPVHQQRLLLKRVRQARYRTGPSAEQLAGRFCQQLALGDLIKP